MRCLASCAGRKQVEYDLRMAELDALLGGLEVRTAVALAQSVAVCRSA